MTERITVIGTGLSGLTMAVALSHHGFAVDLVGPVPADEKDDRTTAVFTHGIAFFRELNIWSACEATATPLTTMELVDGDDHFIYAAPEIDLNEFGFNITNDALKKSLLATIKKNKNMTWHPVQATALKKNGTQWRVTLGNKKSIDADLVIGADGRQSIVRQHSNIIMDARDEDQMAMVTTLQSAKPHHYTSVEWYRTGGPFTTVPMKGNKMALVWCDAPDVLQAKLKTSLIALGTEITRITQQRFGKVTVLAAPQLWPVRPQKAQKLFDDGLVLVGEAAHVLPPIGAQGFNTSLNDIRALTAELMRGRSLGLGVAHSEILSAYERKRLPDIIARYHGLTRLNDMIRAETAPAKMARRLVMKTLGRITPFKKLIMQMGLGRAA